MYRLHFTIVFIYLHHTKESNTAILKRVFICKIYHTLLTNVYEYRYY